MAYNKYLLIRILCSCTILSYFIHCTYKEQTTKKFSDIKIQNQLFLLRTKDRILKQIICDSILKSSVGKCIENLEGESQNSISKIVSIKIETEIKNSSFDYFKNIGKSIVTLTLGVFISNSADIYFKIQRQIGDKQELPAKELKSNGSIARWAILPFYAGFAATNLAALLNNYRNPSNLQRFCLYEQISDLRKKFEFNRDEYCKEYNEYLKNSYDKIENEFINLILKDD